MKDVFIVGARRSPIAAVKKGRVGETNSSCYSALTPEDFAGQVFKTLAGDLGSNIGEANIFRMGSLVAQKAEPGMFHAPAKTLVRSQGESSPNAATFEGACATGLIAIEDAVEEIQLHRASFAIAGGVEMMSRYPDETIQAVLRNPETNEMMWHLADRKAKALGLTREELDVYSFESTDFAKFHQDDHGAFIAPITVPGKESPALTVDEGSSRSLSIELIRKLPTLAGCELITAAHSSKYGDGAAFVGLATGFAAERYGFKPRARILSIEAWSESNPADFIVAPNSAIPKALKSAGVKMKDVDVFIINEAFAPSPVSFIKNFGVPREKVNPWGGAIAFGHPFGATGAILLVMLLAILEKEAKHYGVLAICAAGGEASACVIERVN